MGCYYHNLKHIASLEDIFDDPNLVSHVNHSSLKYYDSLSSTTYKRHKQCIWILVLCIVIFGTIIFFYSNIKSTCK